MKLKRLFLPLVALTMLATSCEHECVYNETYRFNITPSEWQRNEDANLPGSNNYLYCTKKLPAINREVFQNGTVQAFVWNVYNTAQNLGAWNTLPFVYPLEVYDDAGNMTIVPENLRFEWEEGQITFVIQDLDGYDPENMISTISVKVNILGTEVR